MKPVQVIEIFTQMIILVLSSDSFSSGILYELKLIQESFSNTKVETIAVIQAGHYQAVHNRFQLRSCQQESYLADVSESSKAVLFQFNDLLLKCQMIIHLYSKIFDTCSKPHRGSHSEMDPLRLDFTQYSTRSTNNDLCFAIIELQVKSVHPCFNQ